MSDRVALAALRVVANWFALDARELLTQAVKKYNFMITSTADEQEMMSVCLQYCFGQNARLIQVPVKMWRAGCDPERVSALIRLTGYDNRITMDDTLVSMSMDVAANYSRHRKLLSTVGYLQKLSLLVHNIPDMRLCTRLMKTQQTINIFCNSFYSEHAMVSAILRGLSTLPFHVSPDTPGLQNVDFRVNFVRVAWLMEARGYSVQYRDGSVVIDAPGVFPPCTTWTDRKSILQNMPLFYKFSTADHS